MYVLAAQPPPGGPQDGLSGRQEHYPPGGPQDGLSGQLHHNLPGGPRDGLSGRLPQQTGGPPDGLPVANDDDSPSLNSGHELPDNPEDCSDEDPEEEHQADFLFEGDLGVDYS